MITAIVVDDEPRGVNSLKKMLSQECHQVRILAECSDAESAKEKINALQPQLLFLDISMPGKNGFDLLNELGPVSFEVIFTTAHDQYSLQAFRYSAVDYLMKPIDEDLLREAVGRATKRIESSGGGSQVQSLMYNLQRMQTPKTMRICIPGMRGFQVIALEDIIYCKAESSYTRFFLTGNRQALASKSIVEFDSLLKDAIFCRIHKSYLINLMHLKEYRKGDGGSVILTNDEEVEVSRRRKEAFLTQMKRLFKY